jgi:hypothetical protein
MHDMPLYTYLFSDMLISARHACFRHCMRLLVRATLSGSVSVKACGSELLVAAICTLHALVLPVCTLVWLPCGIKKMLLAKSGGRAADVGLHAAHAGLRTRAVQARAMSASVDGVDCYPYGLRSLSAEHNPGGTMAATLRRLGRFKLVPPPGPSKFVEPETAMYELDGAPERGSHITQNQAGRATWRMDAVTSPVWLLDGSLAANACLLGERCGW